MRILHTSDWHLGQHFMGKNRHAEHEALISWLLAEVERQQIDAVIIAGDVFDTGAPPSYARELYHRLVLGLRNLSVSLLILGGNHDSVATLDESRALLAELGVTVMPALAATPDDMVVCLKQKDGSAGALVCALPFIRPRDVLQSRAGESAEQKQQSLQQAIQAQYQLVYQAALARREAFGVNLPIIATGHLTTVGASSSESVREIYVGSLDAFPTKAFPPADYIALGHIHRPQKVGGFEHIRYCGSPIPLGFDEAAQQKEMLLVEVSPDGLQTVTAVPVPCFQHLRSVRGNLASLASQIREAASLGSEQQPVWLEVLVQEDDYLSDIQSRVLALCEDLLVEVLRLRRERGQQGQALAATLNETLDELSPDDVFARRLALETLDEASREALQQRYREVVQSLTEDEA